MGAKQLDQLYAKWGVTSFSSVCFEAHDSCSGPLAHMFSVHLSRV